MKQKTNAPYTRAKSRFAITAIVCLVLSQISGPMSLLPTVEAASSFKPTIFVSTEAFLAIDDDDTTADVVLRFGDTLAKTIAFNRILDRFEFNDDVHTSGSYTASGTIVTESGAYIDGTSLVVQAASNNVGIGTAAPLADLHIVGSETRLDTGTTNGTTSLSFVDNNDEKAHFLLNQATQTFDVQSDGRLSVTSSDYVNVSGTNYTNIQGSTTFIGNNVGIGTTGPKTMLDVAGAISGSFIYATRSFSGAGLTDCDSGTSKLLWDATTGRFSCGTIASSTYTAGQGLSLNGANAFSLNTTITGSLVRFTTVSGSTVYAKSLLGSSGSLAIEGDANIDDTTFVVNSATDDVSIGTTSTNTEVLINSSKLNGTVLSLNSSATNDAVSLGYTLGGAGRIRLTDGFSTNIEISANGSTYFGGGNVGVNVYGAKTEFETRGAISGSTLFASRAFSGAGLSDCDTAGTSKLLWDATTGRFSCGTDQGASYTAGQGLTLTSTSFKVNDTLTGTLLKFATATGSLARFLTLSGSTVYAKNSLRSSGSVIISGPNPTLLTTYNSSGNATGIAVTGRYAYLADDGNGLLILDISKPGTTPALIGQYDTPANALDVAVSGKYAYVADGTAGLHIIDVSNPASPRLIGTYNTSDTAYAVAVAGKYAYVADATSGMHVINIEDPTTPTLTGTYALGGQIRDVAVQGGYAYIGDINSQLLRIIDVSDPTRPIQKGSVSAGDAVYGVAIDGRYAYIAANGAGMKIVDVSNPASPSVVGTYNTPGAAVKVAVGGRYVYVADYNTGGLQIVDVADVTAPVSAGSYLTASYVFDVAISGRYVYLADYQQGMDTIKINGLDAPAATIGTLDTYNLNVFSSARIASSLSVESGLNVTGGLHVLGQSSFHTSSGAALTLTQSGTKVPVLMNVRGLFSGATLYARTTLRSSGSLVWEGAASGATLYLGGKLEGAGLTDCSNGTTSKLLWNSTTGRFSCGTDQTGGGSLTAGQGLTMNGTALSVNATLTGTMLRFLTVSGSTVYAKNALRSSGSLTWEGIGSGAKLFVKDFLSVGSRASGSLLTVGRVGSGTRLQTMSNATLFSTDQMALGQLEGGAYFGRVGITENQWGLSNYGNVWTPKDTTRNWNDIAMSSNGKIQTATVYLGQIYVSKDYGNTWVAKGGSDWQSVAMSSDGKYQTATVYAGQVYTSNDYGDTWVAQGSTQNWYKNDMSSDGRIQAAVTDGGQIYVSYDYGTTWVAKENSRSWTDIAMSSDGKLITATVTTSGFIYVSSDYGNTWTAKDSARDWNGIAMSSDGKFQSAVASSGQVYISNDYGNTWTAKSGLKMWNGITMSSDGRIQAATASSDQIHISTDYGNTWSSSESFRTWIAIAMSSDGKVISAVENSGQIYVSHSNSFQYGSVAIGTGSVKGNTKLMVQGILSGVTLYATKSFSGAGLSDCDTAGTSKLLWDATTGRFSCGTDQGSSYTAGQGLSLNGTSFKVNATLTGTLLKFTTLTGSLVSVQTLSGRTLNITGTGSSPLLSTSLGKPTVRIGGSGSLVLEARSTDPGSTPANTSSLFAQKVGGRSMLHQGSGSTFTASPLQNALFGNLVMMLSTGAGTTVNAYGTTATNDTTVSHPAADQTFGYMTNFATAATSGDDAGTSSTNVAFFRGSTGGANGFFYYARVGVVDTTSIRVFSGMADQSITTMVSADNPTGNHVGFQFSTPRTDSNWQFVTKDNTTQNVVNTGLAFTANKVYDLMFTCTKQCAAITWEIRNVTDGTSAQGTTSSNLPTTSAALRMVLGVESETTAAKNIRMQQIYVEADR